MRWSFSSRQKSKAAGFLLGIMLVTLLTSVSMKRAMQSMDLTLMSVNADRLQPAVDLVYISESLHAKRLLLENQLLSPSRTLTINLPTQLNQHDKAIRYRLQEFEKTRLTQSEAQWLNNFKHRWTEGMNLERAVLRLMNTGQQKTAVQVFIQPGNSLFKQTVLSLHELARIQSETGNQAVKAAHQIAAGVSLDATLLLSISVIIGMLALHFIQIEKLPVQRNQPFNLN